MLNMVIHMITPTNARKNHLTDHKGAVQGKEHIWCEQSPG